MSTHLPILPILIPMLAAVLLLLPPLQESIIRQRVTGAIALSLTLLASLWLLTESLEQTRYYILGGWQPPFGIVLAADPLASILVILTSFLSLAALLAACAGHDRSGMYFHPLFLFQVTGINGAFLTGDIFNLFVFFEILLIASYSLLLHGGGKEKTKAGFHYVTLNLIGSGFFLIALGILYGTLGTLNMADMAVKAASLQANDQLLASAGVLLLLAVFGLKSAFIPLHFWLSKTYGAAVAPIAALFAIMTKVGIYGLYRVHLQIFGDHAGGLANLVIPWLWPLAFITVIIGGIGILSSRRLKDLASWLVIVSVGTLLFSIALNSPQATAAGLYYLVHSTIVTAALYLLADIISKQRGQAGDRFVSARPIKHAGLIGALFIITALAAIGMPPLSGFIGKIALLQSASDGFSPLLMWPPLLLSSVAAIIAFSRAGTTLFWRVRGNRPSDDPVSFPQMGAVALLLLISPLMVVFGNAMTGLTLQAANQLHKPLTIQKNVILSSNVEVLTRP